MTTTSSRGELEREIWTAVASAPCHVRHLRTDLPTNLGRGMHQCLQEAGRPTHLAFGDQCLLALKRRDGRVRVPKLTGNGERT